MDLHSGATRSKIVHLKGDEYFVMGDNSLISGDARYWNDPVDLPREGLNNVSSGRVPERFMLGRAFFVYWPAGYRPGSWIPYGDGTGLRGNAIHSLSRVQVIPPAPTPCAAGSESDDRPPGRWDIEAFCWIPLDLFAHPPCNIPEVIRFGQRTGIIESAPRTACRPCTHQSIPRDARAAASILMTGGLSPVSSFPSRILIFLVVGQNHPLVADEQAAVAPLGNPAIGPDRGLLSP